MSFMLALPKISLHGQGAIDDMVAMLANKDHGKALIVTDGQLVELGLLDGLFSALNNAGFTLRALRRRRSQSNLRNCR
jgi:alcohol dehydrogenase